MPAVQVLGTEGAEQKQVEARGDRQALEEPEAVCVGPVQVLEHDDGRCASGKVPYELGGGSQELVRSVWALFSLEPRCHGAEQGPESVLPGCEACGYLLPVGHIGAHCFEQKGEGAAHRTLFGSRRESSRRGGQVGQELLYEAGLAGSGLPAHESHSWFAARSGKLA